MHHITSLLHAIRTTHAKVDNMRPILTPILRIFFKCDTPAPYQQPIKQGMVPDSSQCGEARQNVIPEKISLGEGDQIGSVNIISSAL